MKKNILILMIAMVITMTISNICMAAGDGIDLDRQQRVIEKFIVVMNSSDNSGFEQLVNNFAPELQDKISMDNFVKLSQEIRGKFGVLQEVRFVAYERFDQSDRITYLASYTRQKVVRLLYGFNKANKMTEFLFIPLDIEKQ